jgi:hypothetical protein
MEVCAERRRQVTVNHPHKKHRRFDSYRLHQDAQRRFTLWQDVPLDPRNDASQTATRVLAKGHSTISRKCGRVWLNALVLKTKGSGMGP